MTIKKLKPVLKKSGCRRKWALFFGIGIILAGWLMMDLKNNSEHRSLQEADGFKIKRAAVDYLSAQSGSDWGPLKTGLLRAVPEIDSRGILRIGEWVYEHGQETLWRYLPPDQTSGYDYGIKLETDGNNWIAIGLSRREVFRKPI